MPRPLAKPLAALLVALCSLSLCAEARALDPELTTPYKVRVVLRVAPNRAFTRDFKEQLGRDLREGLQAALGEMGDVKLIDPDTDEPLLKDVKAKGLQAGLDRPARDAAPVKTHFVNVDYVDGQYEIEARQYDGLIGLASPAVRRERTSDRQYVARSALLLLDLDFGLVGTVTDGGDGKAVRVAFKGAGLKEPLERWLKPNDVLALVQVGADGRTARVPWVLLQAEAAPGEDGSCACKLLPLQHRPLKTAGAGFRCLKLGTVPAPVRVRVVEGGKKGLPQPLKEEAIVTVWRHGFNDPRPLNLVADSAGYCSTEKQKEQDPRYEVAFVTVKVGQQVRAQVALPLVDERTINLPVRPGDESPGVFTARSFWEQSLLNEQVMLDGLFKSLNEDVGKADRKAAALDHAPALERLNERLTRYAEEREELVKSKPAGGKPLDLSLGDRRLKDVEKGRDELRDFVAKVDDALRQENSAEAQEVKTNNARAQKYETDGDYDQAIKLYDKVLDKTNDAKLQERLKKLKAAWAPKDEAHRKARDFIYGAWPKLEEPAVMKERVKEAQDALAVCRKAKDPFGPRKLLAVANSHADKLKQQVEALPPDLDEKELKLAKELEDVVEPLGNLIKEATKAVKETPSP